MSNDMVFDTIATLFHKLEEIGAGGSPRGNGFVERVVDLTERIALENAILLLVERYQMGNRGIIQSQTNAYLASDLKGRADIYFRKWTSSESPKNKRGYKELARHDYNKAQEINDEWEVGITMSEQILQVMND